MQASMDEEEQVCRWAGREEAGRTEACGVVKCEWGARCVKGRRQEAGGRAAQVDEQGKDVW